MLPFGHPVGTSEPEGPEPDPLASDGSAVFDPIVPIMDASAPSVAKPAGDQKRREHLKVAFAKFDTDGSGSLDAEELAQVLTMGSSKLNHAEALQKASSIISKYDFDGNGCLDVRAACPKIHSLPFAMA